MILPVLVRRLGFEAQQQVRFPGGKATNVLRGAFGAALRDVAAFAVYERIFEPKQQTPGPSGLADPPRPILFRAAHLDGVVTAVHDDFHFDVHIFGDPAATADIVTKALAAMWEKGAGVGRGRAKLISVTDRPLELALAPNVPASAGRIRLEFRTPTELKHRGQILTEPDFAILIRRMRDRIATLMALYGPGEPTLDFELFGDPAAAIALGRADIEVREVTRTSGRTGQTHPLGGMVGWAEYTGSLSPFLPFLQAAAYTGVGRHTVWGNGHVETAVLTA